MRFHSSSCVLVSVGLCAMGANGSNIDSASNKSWGENIGWTAWRTAAGASNIEVFADHLAGHIWAENAGWISVGPGGGPYANSAGSDFGVNIEPNGDLSGRGWSENLGWIVFDTRGALIGSGQQARYDSVARRFRGYAWSENAGWINLDDPEHYLALASPPSSCPGDVDGDEDTDVFDFGVLASSFGVTGLPLFTSGDLDGDGDVDVFDFGLFAGAFGCGTE